MKQKKDKVTIFCECADHGCPVHRGVDCNQVAMVRTTRADFADTPRVDFCDPCAEDAADSGCFGAFEPL